MRRADSTTKAADLFGSGKHGYTAGEPGVTQATVLEAGAMNAIQEELAALVEPQETLDPADLHQAAGALAIARELQALSAQQIVTVGTQVWRAFGASGTGSLVAVGEGGAFARSTNLQTWGPGTIVGGPNFRAVAAAPGLAGGGALVAVGETKIYSGPPDSGTLTQRVDNAGSAILGVAWNGVQFCATGVTGTDYDTWTSPEGLAWTRHADVGPIGSGPLRAVGGLFVSEFGYTSPDGVNWTAPSPALPGGFVITALTDKWAYGVLGGLRTLLYKGSSSWAIVRQDTATPQAMLVTSSGVYCTATDRSVACWAGRAGKAPSARDWVAFRPYTEGAIVWPLAGASTAVALGSTGASGEIVISAPLFAQP